MTFSVLNHSIIGPAFYLLPLKVPSPQDWVLNCIYVYLFIHSFTYSYFFFYYYLFVSLNLIYINQVWHFCFEIVQKYKRPFTLHSKCVTANLELWIDYLNVYLDSWLFLGLNLIPIKHRHGPLFFFLIFQNTPPVCLL